MAQRRYVSVLVFLLFATLAVVILWLPADHDWRHGLDRTTHSIDSDRHSANVSASLPTSAMTPPVSPSAIRGYVADADGRSAPDCPVKCYDYRRWLIDTARAIDVDSAVEEITYTDDEGLFEVRASPAVPYILIVGDPPATEAIAPAFAGNMYSVVIRAPLVIAGTVVEENRVPIAGASIEATWILHGSRARTQAVCDAGGRFEMRASLDPTDVDQAFLLRADSPDHAPGFVRIGPGSLKSRTEVVLSLDRGKVIRGAVLDRRTGGPIAGASVSYCLVAEHPARTDNSGRWAHNPIAAHVAAQTNTNPEGRFALRVSRFPRLTGSPSPDNAFGYLYGRAAGYGDDLLDVVPESAQDVVLLLDRPLSIVGRVLDSAGLALPDVLVTCGSPTARPLILGLDKARSALSDEGGAYRIERAGGRDVGGSIPLLAIAAGGFGAEGRLTVLESDAVDGTIHAPDIIVERKQLGYVKVQGADSGRGIEWAAIVPTGGWSEWWYAEPVPGDPGSFCLWSKRPFRTALRCSLEVHAAGYRPERGLSLEVSREATARMQVSLYPLRPVRGRVVWEDGVAAVAVVNLCRADLAAESEAALRRNPHGGSPSVIDRALTDELGGFSLRSDATGAYKLIATDASARRELRQRSDIAGNVGSGVASVTPDAEQAITIGPLSSRVRGASLRGRVLDSDGHEAQGGGTVSARPQNLTTAIPARAAITGGKFRFAWLEEGAWSLTIDMDRFASVTAEVVIDSGRRENDCVVEVSIGTCMSIELRGDQAALDEARDIVLTEPASQARSVRVSPNRDARLCGLKDATLYSVSVGGKTGRAIAVSPSTINVTSDSHHSLECAFGCWIDYVSGGPLEGIDVTATRRVDLVDRSEHVIYSGPVVGAPRVLPLGNYQLVTMEGSRVVTLADFSCDGARLQVEVPVRGWLGFHRSNRDK